MWTPFGRYRARNGPARRLDRHEISIPRGVCLSEGLRSNHIRSVHGLVCRARCAEESHWVPARQGQHNQFLGVVASGPQSQGASHGAPGVSRDGAVFADSLAVFLGFVVVSSSSCGVSCVACSGVYMHGLGVVALGPVFAVVLVGWLGGAYGLGPQAPFESMGSLRRPSLSSSVSSLFLTPSSPLVRGFGLRLPPSFFLCVRLPSLWRMADGTHWSRMGNINGTREQPSLTRNCKSG